KLTTEPITAAITNPSGDIVVPVGHLLLAARISNIEDFAEGDFEIKPTIEKDRILSMFRTPANAKSSDDWTQQFSQHIQITKADTSTLKPPKLEIPLGVQVKISDTQIETTLILNIDLNTLSMEIKGGRFDIEMDKKDFSLLGLNGEFVPKDPKFAGK